MAKLTQRPSREQKKIAELTADLQRIQADFANFKRRTEEDKLRSTRFGRESAVMALLPVVDNFERSFSHVPKELEGNEWIIGIKAVAKQLTDGLKGLGVEKIKSVGERFDPHLHEAVSLEDGDGRNEVVVEELQAGYAMDGELIRHAMVKVRRK